MRIFVFCISFIFACSAYFAQAVQYSKLIRIDPSSTKIIGEFDNFSDQVFLANNQLHSLKISDNSFKIVSIDAAGNIKKSKRKIPRKVLKKLRKINFNSYTQHWLEDMGKIYCFVDTYVIDFSGFIYSGTDDLRITNIKKDLEGVKIVGNKLHGYAEMKGNVPNNKNVRLYEFDLSNEKMIFSDLSINHFFLKQQTPSCFLDFNTDFYSAVSPLDGTVNIYNYKHENKFNISISDSHNKISSLDSTELAKIKSSSSRNASNFEFYSSILTRYEKVWLGRMVADSTVWIRLSRPTDSSFTFVDQIWQLSMAGQYELKKEIDLSDYFANFHTKADPDLIWFGFVYGTKTFCFDNEIWYFMPTNTDVEELDQTFNDLYGKTIKGENQLGYSLMIYYFR